MQIWGIRYKNLLSIADPVDSHRRIFDTLVTLFDFRLYITTHTLNFRFDILDTAALSKVSTSLDKDHISRFVMKYSLHILIFLWYLSFLKKAFFVCYVANYQRVGVFAKYIRLFRKLFPKQWKLTTFTSCFVMLDSFLDNF